jgi:hypothetical protein
VVAVISATYVAEAAMSLVKDREIDVTAEVLHTHTLSLSLSLSIFVSEIADSAADHRARLRRFSRRKAASCGLAR